MLLFIWGKLKQKNRSLSPSERMLKQGLKTRIPTAIQSSTVCSAPIGGLIFLFCNRKLPLTASFQVWVILDLLHFFSWPFWSWLTWFCLVYFVLHLLLCIGFCKLLFFCVALGSCWLCKDCKVFTGSFLLRLCLFEMYLFVCFNNNISDSSNKKID
jgi:hypothetical protein